MLLTKEFVNSLTPCSEGIEAADKYNLWDLEDSEVIKFFTEKGLLAFANWVKNAVESMEAKKIKGEYEYLRYLVYNPIDNVFHPAVTLDEANIIKSNIDTDKSTVYIQEEMKLLSGEIHRFAPVT